MQWLFHTCTYWSLLTDTKNANLLCNGVYVFFSSKYLHQSDVWDVVGLFSGNFTSFLNPPDKINQTLWSFQQKVHSTKPMLFALHGEVFSKRWEIMDQIMMWKPLSQTMKIILDGFQVSFPVVTVLDLKIVSAVIISPDRYKIQTWNCIAQLFCLLMVLNYCVVSFVWLVGFFCLNNAGVVWFFTLKLVRKCSSLASIPVSFQITLYEWVW